MTKIKKIVMKPNFQQLISYKIFEHFALLPDPVTESIKLRSATHKQDAILVPKQVDPLFPLTKRIHPFSLDRVSSQNSDPVTLIQIHVLFVLYKQVS